MEITRELFDQQRLPRFGCANPERMQLEFWEWMIRGHFVPPSRLAPPSLSGHRNGEELLAEVGFISRGGYLKSVYGPSRARDLFDIPLKREEGPIWTFDRMGSTSTKLPDGRTIHVAGGHEDSYDPDFYIYNDVVVISHGPRIEIYGYPREVFQPTDFQTATLVDNRMILIGGLGYPADRCFGHTPVYALDITTYRIDKMEVSGQMPGCIHHHEAEYRAPGIVSVRSGLVLESAADGRLRTRRNSEEFELDLRSGVWRQSTNRKWRQFEIRQEDSRRFARDREPRPENLRPYGIAHTVIKSKEFRTGLIIVEEVPISIVTSARDIQVTIQGHLREELGRQVAEIVCCLAEEKLGRHCILEEYCI
jgi:hypothetical protein